MNKRLGIVVLSICLIISGFAAAVIAQSRPPKPLDHMTQDEFESFVSSNPLSVVSAFARSLEPEIKTAGLETVASNPFTTYSIFACWNTCLVRPSVTDPGGRLSHYRYVAWLMSLTGQKLVINSFCNSSCTVLADSLNKYGLVCVAPIASFWFHRAHDPLSQERFDIPYSTEMRTLLESKGGLNYGFTIIKYDDLATVIPKCGRDVKVR